MESQNTNPNRQPGRRRSRRDMVIGWITILALLAGITWLYNRNKEREAQRKRELLREVNWVVTEDGVKVYKTHPGQDVKARVKEINSRYKRPIWEDVPEDRSGKGRVIISP